MQTLFKKVENNSINLQFKKDLSERAYVEQCIFGDKLRRDNVVLWNLKWAM